MRKCPVCDIELVLKEYEGEKLMSCSECHGYLIDLSAVERIKRKEQISSEQLQVEIEEEFSYNSEYEMRCPRCRMTMKKVIESLPGVEVEIDYCKSCAMIWLDGGELAKIQLGHEATEKAAEMRAMKTRSLEFEADSERKAEFAENVAKAPDPSDPLTDGVRQGIIAVLGRRSGWLHLFDNN